MAEYQGIPINYDVLPDEVKAAIDRDISQVDFGLRLRAGGTVTLNGSDLVIGGPSYEKNTFAFIALDKLELKNNAKIITNGNTVVIFVNKLHSENCSIVSFSPADKRAKAGTSGSAVGESGRPGSPGDSGGIVAIHVIQELHGTLNVNLDGQDGGHGGNGVKGSTGAEGPRGGDAADSNWPFPGCKHSGGDGGRGYSGGPGGHGGDAGHGGQGGQLFFYNVGAAPIPQASYTFVAAAGSPGNPGIGGAGGDGGRGGDGGHGSTYCDGGNRGPNGYQGPNGDNGSQSLAGAAGLAVVKNLDFELILRRLP
ncbi:hypothetical protein [Crenobacter cavernae]|uniref:hypothetical protein n=1 Tax=Crenobacter cavernae TaxID=2290923 RepID=UPI0011C08421|nr:hypothetical protein [Crenobacter cavernae]